jgi:hypothetical protein
MCFKGKEAVVEVAGDAKSLQTNQVTNPLLYEVVPVLN